MSEKYYKISDSEFTEAVMNGTNICQTLKSLKLAFRGASYRIFKERCKVLNLDLGHFKSDKVRRKELSKEQITEVIQQGKSRNDCLILLGLNPLTGANIRWLSSFIKIEDLQTSHWLGLAHAAGTTHNRAIRKPLKELLSEGTNISNNQKKRLIKEGILKNKCYECGISSWRDKPLSLHLDHINGCHSDNRLENLRILCPNCHSQTETYCKAKSSFIKEKKKSAPKISTFPRFCTDCNISISAAALRCKSCKAKSQETKIVWPPIGELRKRLEQSNYSSLARELSVTASAIKKRLKNHS